MEDGWFLKRNHHVKGEEADNLAITNQTICC